MKKPIIALIALSTVIALSQCVNSTPEDKPTFKAVSSTEDYDNPAERGEYMVKMIGCDHCHTPKKMTPQGPVPDMDKWLMGYPGSDPLPEIVKDAVGPGKWILMHGDLTASVGPWGISYAANLTPHETGLGTWSYEQFKKSMTAGKHKGLENGRPVMPPMPWQTYREMAEEDLQAIFAYLQSIKPIENAVPAYVSPDKM